MALGDGNPDTCWLAVAEKRLSRNLSQTPRIPPLRGGDVGLLLSCVGVSPLKEGWKSRELSWSRFREFPCRVTHLPRRSLRTSFLWGCSVSCVSLARTLPILRSIAHGLIDESGCRRFFHGDCTSSHPFVNPLPCGKRSGRLLLRRPRTELSFTTIPRDQARPNQTDAPLGSLPRDPRHTSD